MVTWLEITDFCSLCEYSKDKDKEEDVKENVKVMNDDNLKDLGTERIILGDEVEEKKGKENIEIVIVGKLVSLGLTVWTCEPNKDEEEW